MKKIIMSTLVATAVSLSFAASANVTPHNSILKGEKHFLTGYSAHNLDGTINVVVEIPAGQTAKYEVNKTTGMLELEQKNGQPRFVKYLGYNYIIFNFT